MFPIIDSFIRRQELSDIFLFLCNWVFLLFKIKWFIRTDTLWVSNIYGDWRITAQETGTVSKIYQQAGGGIHPLTTIADIANQTYSVKCTADIFWNCWGQGALKYYVSNVNTAAAGEGGRAVCETYIGIGEKIFSSTWCLMDKCSFKCQKPQTNFNRHPEKFAFWQMAWEYIEIKWSEKYIFKYLSNESMNLFEIFILSL